MIPQEKHVRVYNLYRVSTKGQVDHDDIPVQKKACHTFVESKNGWRVVREESELGISGSKVSASNRDVIQDYLMDAKAGKFDVLLVFMFDRLGRIEDETPFVLEAFVKAGVECWSVCEGQQKIENHTDKLLNYIRFWQAAGETYKMAQRIGETHSQIVKQGHFRGGYVPFGYVAVDKGRRNKKDEPLLGLEVDLAKSLIVKEIFDKAAGEGLSSYAIAEMLNSRKIIHNTGSKFSHNTVIRLLRNAIYTGFYKTSKAESQHLPELQIVPQDIFERVACLLTQRAKKQEDKRTVAAQTKKDNLLSGNLYCGHCNKRLSSFRHIDRYTRKDGSLYELIKPKYQCYHKSKKLTDCDGQHHYDADRIDVAVVAITKDILYEFKDTPKDLSIEWQVSKHVQGLQSAQKELEKKLLKVEEQKKRLNSEVALCLLGESSFTQNTLTDAIQTVNDTLKQNQTELDLLNRELSNQTAAKNNINAYYEKFESWCDEFNKTSIKRKRMILSELYDRIEVRRGYVMAVYINKNYEQFLSNRTENEKPLSKVG